MNFVSAHVSGRLQVGAQQAIHIAPVLHKAIIEEPDATAHRVINSAGFTLPGMATPKTAAEIERFLTRDDLD